MSRPPIGRRELMIGGACCTAGLCAAGLWRWPAAFRLNAQVTPTASVPDFRARGDRDDSAAFARALATGRAVTVPAGRGSGAGGAYVVDTIRLPAGARIDGDGEASVIRPRSLDVRQIFQASSAAPDAFLSGIAIRHLAIEGRLPGSTFREHWNLIELAGVEDVVIENVRFRGFVGDAITFGGERLLDPRTNRLSPRHNRRLIVRACRFDGIDRNTRNAISIVDGTDVLIDGCVFDKCTRPDMPGAIDVEPNPYPFYRVGNITVANCQFMDCGGSNGVVGVYVPLEVAEDPSGFRFIGNRFEGSRTADIYVNVRRNWSRPVEPTAVTIESNTGSGGDACWRILAASGVRIGRGNAWTDYSAAALLGYQESGSQVHDFIDEATYTRIGRGGPPSQFGIAVFNVTNARFGGTFVDCGDGSADAAAIAFVGGRAEGIDVANARFLSTNRSGRQAVREFGDRMPAGDRARLRGAAMVTSGRADQR